MNSFRLAFYTLAAIIITACNQTDKTSKENPTDNPNEEINLDSSLLKETEKCFLAFVGKDSAFLSLKKNGEAISGDLIYQFYEKDNNKGSLKGTLNGDTLILDYTFQSEGTTSTRPLKFLITKNRIYEIYGANKAEEGKGFIFDPADCKTL
ncbi:hypothetical protein [Pedobacter cryophilus]|uniref:Lipoprotein n=1 Tax=Pedobacter cryophilus TaxID=2571271 RepID=A0A4U1BZB2_9SPHI|nr:hypothetical protein [Pedobacter cryophilus]TKB97848.1 hypothetical protein FA046_10885 [Pedobacter cryophilus]